MGNPKARAETTPSTNAKQTPSGSSAKTQSLDIYEKMDQVGEGTYGKVYKARNRHTGIIVALKRIRMESEKEGFPVTAMREIKLLQSMSHKHIIKIHEIAVHKAGSVYMVLDYMDYDLTGFLGYPKLELSHAHIKCLMKQILEGIHYLHGKNVLHRDIKGSNILMNRKGEVKLADFGLARVHERNRLKDYTNRVITLWYRPPELLLGATKYGAEVDIWSVGCIMMELFMRKPVFQGSDEITQLEQIYRIMGAPNKADWPSVVELPWFGLVRPKDKSGKKFKDYFKKIMTPAALDLAERLLSMNPAKRPTAQDALSHPYFTSEEPEACSIQKLPTIDGDWHEYESKQRKKKQALDQAQRSQSQPSTRPSKERPAQ
ncbi:Pkinase-domain-containing protein [Basidiobolus meristosporus CBS 931.73]|uniref:Pkinase-domain-containing protein n=1 Tax=Basidiobolus meristosporus CBS 931.73 TaxID=1314790 RepID=A0A1Y1ZB85_9FUNG|nr:Pkinase-domain-containing protein [Basidiobolus meristosporus CBS 931.73]|eukprot:ORY07446.1 Pkinase-domain-containing protein [Basidiobolus meristosporus CBS 931.73]